MRTPTVPEVAGAGGDSGAGVTFGVGRGVERETYGSSMTEAGRTMCSWPAAAPTMRAGVSSSATASSLWRWPLCSREELCWEGREADLSVGQQCLADDDGQQSPEHQGRRRRR